MWFPSILLAKFGKKLEIFFLLHLHVSAIFTKANNFCDYFLFACLEKKPFQNGVYSKRKEFAPDGADSFPSDNVVVDPFAFIKP